MKTSLFIDTTILIRYKNIGEIDFNSIFDTEDIEILIPMQVIIELDKHKDGHKNISIQKKARNWINFFEGLDPTNFSTILKNKITLKLIPKEPKIVFDDHDLDSGIPDDRIIANLIEYRNENKDNAIVLISDDGGIKIKAKFRGFGAESLDSEYKLNICESKLEKEIKKLKLENSKFQNKIPKLDLAFQNEFRFKKHIIEKHPQISSTDINSIIENIKKRIPKIGPEELSKKNIMVSIIETYVEPVSTTKINEYNNNLDVYYSNVRDYLNKVNTIINQQNRIIKIQLLLKNTGTVPANDIDINIEVPLGWRILEELPNGLTIPKIPIKPLPSALELIKNFSQENLRDIYIDSIKTPTLKFEDNYCNIINNQEICYNFNKLKHFQEIDLKDFYLISEKSDIPSFSMKCKINADDIPNTTHTNLSLSIETEEMNAPIKWNENLINLLTTK